MINILVLGDSHTQVFSYCNQKQDKIKFDVIAVGGATAQGIVNPNSKTDALSIYKDYLKNIKRNYYSYIIINLGEVDCGFVIWYRKNKYNISVDEQLALTTNNLFKFIDTEIKPYFASSTIIINGSILPTIKDNTDVKYLLGARSEVNTPLIDRTLLTLRYNDMLKNYSSINGHKYMDITCHIIDNVNKIVDQQFLNANIYDHHLDNDKTYQLWLCELHKIIV